MRLRAGLVLAGMLLARSGQAHNFVGAQACGSCHAFEYRVWSQSPHARAHQSLTPQQLSDTRCSTCHTTLVDSGLVDTSTQASLILREPAPGKRAGEPVRPDGASGSQNGPDAHAKMAADPNGPNAKFLGVQCEACHGPGALYQPEYVMRDRELSRLLGLVDQSPQVCQGCHSEGAPSLAPFDYKSAWARIDHGREARLAYEAAIRAEAPVAPAPPAPAPPAGVKSRPAHGPRPQPRRNAHRHHRGHNAQLPAHPAGNRR